MLDTETAYLCVGGAPWKRAHSFAPMLDTETACLYVGGAACMPAHTLDTASIMLGTETA